jgi:hypothetical protein
MIVVQRPLVSAGIWFQGHWGWRNRKCWGYIEFSFILQKFLLHHLIFKHITYSFLPCKNYHNFYLLSWYHLFWGDIFLQIKGRENPQLITQDLKTTADSRRLTESSAYQLNVHVEIKHFCFWNFFCYLLIYLIFWLCLVNIACNKPANKAGLPY